MFTKTGLLFSWWFYFEFEHGGWRAHAVEVADILILWLKFQLVSFLLGALVEVGVFVTWRLSKQTHSGYSNEKVSYKARILNQELSTTFWPWTIWIAEYDTGVIFWIRFWWYYAPTKDSLLPIFFFLFLLERRKMAVLVRFYRLLYSKLFFLWGRQRTSEWVLIGLIYNFCIWCQCCKRRSLVSLAWHTHLANKKIK